MKVITHILTLRPFAATGAIQTFKRASFNIIIAAVAFLSVGGGCSSSFTYTPGHDRVYVPIPFQSGLAIRTGRDLRAIKDKQPAWTEAAEVIVAHALASEVTRAKLFPRVKIHADQVNPNKYSEIVRFQVIKFECLPRPGFLETTGRELLQSQGIHGALIAASIPTRYISDLEIEFEVIDAVAQQSVFLKTYFATRTVSANGYQDEKPQIEQTSAALQDVLTQFLGDLTKISSRRRAPSLYQPQPGRDAIDQQ